MKSSHVSIIIPTHNRAHVIERAIRSILVQSFQDFEIIIVDDGSTDNTCEIVKTYANGDPRVRLIRHAGNRGAQAARNTGAAAAGGAWIAFLDSDDEWLPQSLDIRLRTAERLKAQIVYSECYVRKSANHVHVFNVPRMQGRIYSQILRSPGPMFQSMLISSRVFLETGGLDENIVSYQEWDTAIQLSKKGLFGYVEEPTFIYDCTGVDTISKDGLRGAEGYSQIVSKHFFQILINLGPRAISQHYHYIASRHRLAGDVLTARIFKRKAVAWRPSPLLVIRHFSTILKRTVLPKNRGLR